MVLPSVGTILTGTAATGAGISLMKNGESVVTNEILSDSIPFGHRPGGADDDDDDDDDSAPPPYDQTGPKTYLFTSNAVQAIVKSWGVAPYNPPGTDVVGWMGKVRRRCEVYRVPDTQQALCAMLNMRADCREAANAAGCYDMTWDQFTKWLLKLDGAYYLGDLVLVFGR